MPETATSFINQARLDQRLDISRGSAVADFGAGSGFYTIPLAEKVGPEGKVYAFDIQKDAVARIQSLARLRHFLNVDAIVADLELPNATHLREAVCDLVLVASVLHQAGDPAAILKEAQRILKPGRMLIIVEWGQSNIAGGPPPSMRLLPPRTRALAESAGFIFDRDIPAGSHHYGLLFRR